MKIENNILNIPEDKNPSIELDMHRLIQISNKKTKSVVHLHPTYTISLMYKIKGKKSLIEVCSEFPEIYRYTKVGEMVDLFEPGSEELAESVYNSFIKEGKLFYDIVGMQGHGVTAVADNPWDAFEHIERLEHISKIYLSSGV
jgi:L-fuculose-phosphate aldolase